MAVIARCLILILWLITIAEGRILSLNSSNDVDQLISDGMNDQDSSVTENLSSCRHQYGFLPCAENATGYIFLIFVYQVLLIVGGKMIGGGSEVLFYITGEQFGGILFRILRALPSMSVMIYSGIFSDKGHAQAQVSSVVGIYAGITVFSLTVQWFMVVVSASKPLKEKEKEKEKEEEEECDDHEATTSSASRNNCFSIKEKLRILIDRGVTVDEDTCRTAKIMLLSLIPYVLLQLVYAFDTASGKRIITLIALIVSSSSLILYFVYQIRNPWMQKRSLDYSKIDIVQRGLMQHVERLGKLVNEDGSLNTDLVKSFFDKADKDDNQCIAVEELEELVSDVFKAGKADIARDDAMNKVLSKLDNNQDEKITEDEFIDGFVKWIHEAKQASNNEINATEMYHKALQLLKEKKDNKSPDIDKIMSKILKQAEGQMLKSEALIKENGEPNIERIQNLFREHDNNKDGSLSTSELKKLIGKVKFGTYQMKDEDVVKEMFRVFDKDGNNEIDEDEFMKGVKGYLDKAIKAVGTTEKTRIVQEFDKIVWKEQVYGKKAFFKSVLQVLLGIAMLTFLAGPLMGNILDFSNAMNIPSFIVSFVVVPLAMNGQVAIAALLPASKKTKGTSSLTFSEIYGGVIMNNIAGLTTLLAIVYAKDLTWDFSAEVLTIMVVCAIIGTQAFLSTTYQLWTCIPAFLLYPISLGLFYFFQVFYKWN